MSTFTYDLLKTGIDVSSLRQKSISSNIANIKTEGYKANVVPFERFLSDSLDRIEVRKTHERHFDLNGLDVREEKRKGTYVNDNGNNVDLDLEMSELAANELYYGALVRQINSKLSGLNYVINR